MGLLGLAIGGIGSAVTAGINNLFGQQNAARNAARNFYYGEKAAANADARTRALYKDIYSPKALLKQYQEAGLSPSMMFGGTPGQGGMAGAMGTGAGNQGNIYMPMSMIESAEVANLIAQTKKTEAETKNVEIDTIRQEIAKEMEELHAGQYQTEWDILNSTWTEDQTGARKSLFEAARDHFTYESFINWCRNSDNTPEKIKNATQTEAGQRILREIYRGASQFDRDIIVLSGESVSADFQRQLITAMKDKDFINLNAQSAVGYLKANIQTAELNETQKEAWNNLINRLGKQGSTTRDIIVVLGMILNQAASNWHMPTFNTYQTNDNSVRTINVGQK